jgi:hypothetical protein
MRDKIQLDNQGGRSFQSPSGRTRTVRRTAGLKQPRVDGLHERPAETLESNRLIVAGMIASSSATIGLADRKLLHAAPTPAEAPGRSVAAWNSSTPVYKRIARSLLSGSYPIAGLYPKLCGGEGRMIASRYSYQAEFRRMVSHFTVAGAAVLVILAICRNLVGATIQQRLVSGVLWTFAMDEAFRNRFALLTKPPVGFAHPRRRAGRPRPAKMLWTFAREAKRTRMVDDLSIDLREPREIEEIRRIPGSKS